MFSVWQNWETLEKRARAMNVSGNIHSGKIMFPVFLNTNERKNSSQKDPNGTPKGRKQPRDMRTRGHEE